MGRIIKAEGRILPGEAFDDREQARKLREEAAALLSQARVDAKSEREQARAEGFAEGQREGREAGKSELTQMLADAAIEAERLRQIAARAAVPLARKMAEKIIGHAIDVDANLVTEIAVFALGQSRPRAGRVLLHCHPQDIEILRRDSPRLASQVASGVVVELRPDEEIERGGCIVETALGRLDARLATQLDALQRVLLKNDPGID